jgi:hypothetical protein
MTKQQITLLAMAMALSAPAFAAPRECIRDDATGHARIMHTCNVKCLAVVPDMDYPTEMTARCEAGVAGHGTSCFPLSTIKFVTPCNIQKDLYDGR